MRVLIRADASLRLGAGHVMRCLTLAQALERQGAETRLLCRAHPGHLGDFLRVKSADLCLLPAEDEGDLGATSERDADATRRAAAEWGADAIIVDHYSADAAWEAAQDLPVMAIDDAPLRDHDATLLLDQNLGANGDDYAPRLPTGAQVLAGTRYALLRPEFAQTRRASLERRAQAAGALRHILISMGGTDLPDATSWVLEALAGWPQMTTDLRITVVMGPTAPHLDRVRDMAAALACSVTVLAGSDRMADLMAGADLAIGAAGSTTWERCALGLPAIMVVLADNQRVIAEALAASGAARDVALRDTPTLVATLSALVAAPQSLVEMSRASAAICDGLGADRVASALLARLSSLAAGKAGACA